MFCPIAVMWYEIPLNDLTEEYDLAGGFGLLLETYPSCVSGHPISVPLDIHFSGVGHGTNEIHIRVHTCTLSSGICFLYQCWIVCAPQLCHVGLGSWWFLLGGYSGCRGSPYCLWQSHNYLLCGAVFSLGFFLVVQHHLVFTLHHLAFSLNHAFGWQYMHHLDVITRTQPTLDESFVK